MSSTAIEAAASALRRASRIRWAALIESDFDREMALLTIARAWRREDEAAAYAWLDHSPLSEDARERVRTHAPERKPSGRSR